MNEKTDKLAQFSALVGELYILLLGIPMAIGGKGYMHDGLIVLMGAALLFRRGLLHLRSWTHICLYVFLLVSLGVVCCQPFFYTGWGIRDAFEWAIFGYMGILFLFYSEFPLERRQCLLLSRWIICGILFTVGYEILSGIFGWQTLFCYESPQMSGTAMSFLSRRFQCTQSNPNHFGLYALLPFGLMYRAFLMEKPKAKVLMWVLPLCLLYCVPLAWSASKHCVAVVALMLCCVYRALPGRQLTLRIAGTAAVVLAVIICEVTVLFVTFPLSSKAPFIDTTAGMYTIHQKAYGRMLLSGAEPYFIIGAGASEAKLHYAEYVDAISAKETLGHYNASDNIDGFTTFMDPHNEFLNLAVLFGVPAAIWLFLFIMHLPFGREFQVESRWEAALFVFTILATCLWDDALSKRALWISLALFFPVKQHHQINIEEHN